MADETPTAPTIADVYDTTLAYSAGQMESVNELIALLNSALSASLTISTAGATVGAWTPPIPPSLSEPMEVTMPGAAVTSSLPSFPDVRALRDLVDLVSPDVDPVSIPVFEAILPPLAFPEVPDEALPVIPDNVPVVGEVDIPTAPSFTLPAVPVLADIAVPAPPEVALATFEGVLPTTDLTAPEPLFVWTEGNYQSDLADAVRTRLYTDVTLGGTGLSASVEADLWARAIERLDYELEKAYSATLDAYGASGFEMPDGVLAAQLREVLAENNRRRQDTNRDISFKQAELAQQNTQFAITNGLVYEKQAVELYNQIAERSLNAAKHVVEATISVFNVKVLAHNTKLEGYKTEAAVYESRLRGELVKVEMFKAQVEGARLSVEMQAQVVEIYSKRLQAIQTLLDLYRAQMDGAKIRSEVDRVQIEAFRAVVEAKSAQIAAHTARFGLYKAQIEGEDTKVKLYTGQVEAFKARVEAVKVESETRIEELKAKMEVNKHNVEVLREAVNLHRANIDGTVGLEGVEANVYGTQASQYAAQLQRAAASESAAVERFKGQVAAAAAAADVEVKRYEANIHDATLNTQIQTTAQTAAAQIAAQLTASLNAQHNFSTNTSTSYNQSRSSSFSRNTEYRENRFENENHIYSYDGDA